MDFRKIVEIYSKIAICKKINDDMYEIVTGAKINGKIPVKILLRKNKDAIELIDDKTILKTMNPMYDLNAVDVRDCIASVIKIYKFTIVSGNLVAQLHSEKNALETIYNFIMCYGQLINMYAFFDQPE